MASKEIKDIIRDFVNFDVEKNYYQKEDKEELVRDFKKILYEDDVTVRKFLKSFFILTKKLANEYSLVAKEGEAIEDINNTENEEGDSGEETEKSSGNAEKETKVPESYKLYRSVASNILYE